MTLEKFLSCAAATPPRAGRFDCLLFPADWVLLRHGLDPAAPWRGRYDTWEAADAIVVAEGGLAGLMRKGLAPLGLLETTDPVPGDVGALHVRTAVGPGLVGGIKTGLGWAVLGRKGLKMLPAGFVVAWKV